MRSPKYPGLKKRGFASYVAIDVGMVSGLDAHRREWLEFLEKKGARYRV